MSAAKTIGDIEVTALSDGVRGGSARRRAGHEPAEAERLAGRKDAINISVERVPAEARWQVGAGRYRLRQHHGADARQAARQSSRVRRSAREDRDDLSHSSASRPFQRPGRRRGSRRSIQRRGHPARDRKPASGSTATKRAVASERIRRNIAKAAVTTGALSQAHAHRARRRSGSGRGGRVGRACSPATRPAIPAGSSSPARRPADLGRCGPPRRDPDPPSRHRSGLRRRSAGRLRDPPAHRSIAWPRTS